MSKAYSETVLRAMCLRPHRLETLLEWHDVRADGVWVTDAPDALSGEAREVWEWHPLANRDLPALPFPFTAAQLAAFMLYGGGQNLLEQFIVLRPDAQASGVTEVLDDESLAELGANSGQAREALAAAHTLLSSIPIVLNFDSAAGLHATAAWLLNRHTGDLRSAMEASVASQPQVRGDRIHRALELPTRGDLLSPLIRDVVAELGTYDVDRVWAFLWKLTEEASPRDPIFGRMRDGTIKWCSADREAYRFLSRKMLAGRLSRLKKSNALQTAKRSGSLDTSSPAEHRKGAE